MTRDGYRRLICPAAEASFAARAGPGRSRSPASARRSPDPPKHPPTCCSQQTITIPESWTRRPRKSTTTPLRRTAPHTPRRPPPSAPFSTIKDPAANDIKRGWCRLIRGSPRAHCFSHCAFRSLPNIRARRRLRPRTRPKISAAQPPGSHQERRKTPPTHLPGPNQRRQPPALTSHRASDEDEPQQHPPTQPQRSGPHSKPPPTQDTTSPATTERPP